MNVTDFLENLAKEAYYSTQFDVLVKSQSKKIQEAINKNNPALIKNQFLEVGYLANGSTVMEIQLARN